MESPPKLSFACPLPWQTMSGDERSRFCSQCSHHVHNLSLLSQEERLQILARAGTERLCGSYYMRLSGKMVTPSHPLSETERSRVVQFGAAALSAGALALAAGCVSPTDTTGEPASNSNPPAITSPASAGASIEAKTENDEEIVLFVGLITCEPEPTPTKPGPPSKRW